MARPRQPQERAVIGEYASTGTVRALIERGYIQPIAFLSRGDPWICELTEKGKAEAG